MARIDADEKNELAVEVAKLKVRVAAEKAEPGRLLRQGIRAAPLGSIGGATLAGALLAVLRRRRRARPLGVGAAGPVGGVQDARSGLGALALAVGLELAQRYLPELLGREAAPRTADDLRDPVV